MYLLTNPTMSTTIIPEFQKTDRFTIRSFIDSESNHAWTNWTNDVLSKNNQNQKPYENIKKVKEDSKPPILLKQWVH